MSTWNGKYVSLESIIEKVQRDTGSIIPINIADCVEWAGEAIEAIKAPMTLLQKYEEIEIEEYRGKLPCDIFMIEGVKHKNGLPLRYSSDIYHSLIDCSCINNGCNYCEDNFTYTINNDYIFTKIDCGTLIISYKGIPIDDKGWPLIPDDFKFTQAIKSYIIERLFIIGNFSGKITENQLERAIRDRRWYIGAAQNRGNLPSYDQMESLKNNLIRLIPKINQHYTGFSSADNPEQRYVQNAKSNNVDRNDNNIPVYFYTG